MPHDYDIDTRKDSVKYDDPSWNYQDYWLGRDYEHAAEELAIKRLLRKKHFNLAVDVGGGYGRLSRLLCDYADHVILAEPSAQQLEIGRQFLKNYPKVKLQLDEAKQLKLTANSVDLAIMIRLMHHLPDPMSELKELYRVLKPGGLCILEVANYAHARNRLKHLLKGRPLPIHPVDIRSEKSRKENSIAFVNHNPKTVAKQVQETGFEIRKVLSVSNLRSPHLKKVVPMSFMVSVERLLQPALAKAYFGPSVFFLLRKK